MEPYVTFVIPARNDNYGGDQARRLALSLLGLVEQIEAAALPAEILLVDWNPPQYRPSFFELIPWPARVQHTLVSGFRVPEHFHLRIPEGAKRPLATAHAYNVGIRRARGKFVTPRASDVFYSTEIISFIARQELNVQSRYRVNRCDVPLETLSPKLLTLNDRLDFCANNILREYGFTPSKGQFPVLHTDACGDFQLMQREYWHQLKGYWERDIVNSHCDSLLSYASYVAGIQEIVIKPPTRVFKVFHEQQFTQAVKEGDSTASREGAQALSWEQAFQIIVRMLKREQGNVFNDDSWGLGDESLEEVQILSPE